MTNQEITNELETIRNSDCDSYRAIIAEIRNANNLMELSLVREKYRAELTKMKTSNQKYPNSCISYIWLKDSFAYYRNKFTNQNNSLQNN